MKALLIVPRLPGTGHTGDRVRATQHLVALARAGFDTTVVGGRPGGGPAPLVEGAGRVIPVPIRSLRIAASIPLMAFAGDPLQTGLLAGRWGEAVRQAGKRFDLTIVLLVRLWPHVEGYVESPIVLDYIDALAAGAEQASRQDPALWRRLYWRAESPRLRRLERRAARRSSLLLATTTGDAASLPAGTLPVPLGVHLTPAGPAVRPPIVAFSGRLRYRPNELAARRLVDGIWPRVASRVPGAQLRIGGADPPGWLRSMSASRGVRLVSPVVDMPGFLREARVVAAPVELGSGSQLKLLEAFEAGCAVVASPEVAARAAAGPGTVPARIATSDEEIADALVALLRDPDAASREGRAGRAFVESHCDRSRFTDVLAGHFRRLVSA